jgi:hypothetical protein
LISVPELTRGAGIQLNARVSLATLCGWINPNAMTANYPTPLWPWIAVLACTGIVAAGALALIGYIVLALIGY